MGSQSQPQGGLFAGGMVSVRKMPPSGLTHTMLTVSVDLRLFSVKYMAATGAVGAKLLTAGKLWHVLG